MDIKNFISAIAQIAEEKEIPQEKVIETVEQAIAAAYKKDYGKKGQIIRAKISSETGDVKFWQVRIIVDESMILAEDFSLSEAMTEQEEPAFAKAPADAKALADKSAGEGPACAGRGEGIWPTRKPKNRSK